MNFFDTGGGGGQISRVTDFQGYRSRFLRDVGPIVGESLFDSVPDVVFFVKDGGGRYVSANRTLVQRCGRKERSEIIGRTAREVFPGGLGDTFSGQDAKILATGRGIRDHLELHLSAAGQPVWCLTHKEAVRTSSGKIAGVCGISRDLHPPGRQEAGYAAMAKTLEFIHGNFGKHLLLADLAEMAGLSAYQFDQRIRQLFQLSAGQYLIRTRMEAARSDLTDTELPISVIAQRCGYADQAAFSRQFKQVAGISPSTYRETRRVAVE